MAITDATMGKGAASRVGSEKPIMTRSLKSVRAAEEFSRTRLSPSFFMRDFLFSEIAAIEGLSNLPSDPDLAIAAGRDREVRITGQIRQSLDRGRPRPLRECAGAFAGDIRSPRHSLGV